MADDQQATWTDLLRCERCDGPLDVPGALIFSPPRTDGTVRKHHICAECYPAIVTCDAPTGYRLVPLPDPELEALLREEEKIERDEHVAAVQKALSKLGDHPSPTVLSGLQDEERCEQPSREELDEIVRQLAPLTDVLDFVKFAAGIFDSIPESMCLVTSPHSPHLWVGLFGGNIRRCTGVLDLNNLDAEADRGE